MDPEPSRGRTLTRRSDVIDTHAPKRKRVSSPLDNRPDLSPTPPSSSLSRSSSRSPERSPAYLVRFHLGEATPPVTFEGPSLTDKPPLVRVLEDKLKRDLPAFIPEQFLDQLTSVEGSIPSYRVSPSLAYPPQTWDRVCDIHTAATACVRLLKDENAWVEVVKDVFKLAVSIDHDQRTRLSEGDERKMRLFEVNSIQTQSIYANYLPRNPAALNSFAKKTDLAIAFNGDHELVRTVTSTCPSRTSMSPMSNAYTECVPLVCPVEVKSWRNNGVAGPDAEVQLGIWQAAALNHLHCMFVGQDGSVPSSPPHIGWTVIGHDWKIYIAWKDGVRGPTTIWTSKLDLPYSTESISDIFGLLFVLRRMFEWLVDDYWPEFSRCVSSSTWTEH